MSRFVGFGLVGEPGPEREPGRRPVIGGDVVVRHRQLIRPGLRHVPHACLDTASPERVLGLDDPQLHEVFQQRGIPGCAADAGAARFSMVSCARSAERTFARVFRRLLRSAFPRPVRRNVPLREPDIAEERVPRRSRRAVSERNRPGDGLMPWKGRARSLLAQVLSACPVVESTWSGIASWRLPTGGDAPFSAWKLRRLVTPGRGLLCRRAAPTGCAPRPPGGRRPRLRRSWPGIFPGAG